MLSADINAAIEDLRHRVSVAAISIVREAATIDARVTTIVVRDTDAVHPIGRRRSRPTSIIT